MITYLNLKNKRLETNQIIDLYNNVGWANYTKNPTILIKGIKASLGVFVAFDNDDLIGLIRVVGDGFTIIYIQDILVKTTYQSQGIGQQLLKMVLSEYEDVRQKILMTDNQEKVIRFYEKCGFKQMKALNLVGFVKINHQS